MIFQNFDIRLDDPHYQPIVKQALTIKPGDLHIRVSARKNMDATAMDTLIHGQNQVTGRPDQRTQVNGSSGPSRPMTILYGSNTGTCQAFAQKLASEAAGRGFQADVRDLDSATSAIPPGIPVVIITSSYEGQPPDNAARFVEWLSHCKPGSLAGVQYTVFGCGNREPSPQFLTSYADIVQMIGLRPSTVSPN
jgi:cytochrome P450 / NADPH-cytochrome P450 reductase